ncbi:CRISPR-associated protein Csx11 [Thermosipho sp. (in: thermotogales)]|jgi:hypothetical protein|uniref:CRISPR-associated protein Csx11 n=1 Tax=Thermosipho sp. (in: thermotogales) TaxID=1968895 RepID=UPI00257DCA68|nr:CRISPR-associated protein Csx11 [Thermosipho sp. (in: thermotogales)]MBZ4650974.1 CRISPR-associated protein Csx11 family [Thermosipho sp. (in: thermotogales)]
MSELNLENLKKHRDEILKAEITSLLALWNKVDPNQQNKANINLVKKSLSDWEKDIKNKKIKILEEEFELWSYFLNNWRDKRRSQKDKKYLLQVLYGIGESLNSGIDKGSPKDNIKVEPQNRRWLSNPFGSFKNRIIYLSETENSINYKIFDLRNSISNILGSNNLDWEKFKSIREKFEKFFTGLLSDDRFPINDVSLWEQAYMATTMFKASLSEYILKNNNIQNLPKREDFHWRILGIQYDKLRLAERGYKPQQIQWYREASNKIDDEIKKLLEYDYPIGNEIYRDETGIYFLVGEDLGEDLNDNSNLAKLKRDLKEIEERIMHIFKEKSFDEFYPAIFLTKASRGLMNLSYLLEKSKENFLKTDWSKKEVDIYIEKSESEKAIGICQVCGQRLVFESDRRYDDKNICDVCFKEKTQGRIDKWLEDTSKETIWMDELKDKNDRVALVTVKFELHDWLNGDMLNSIVLQENIDFDEDVKKIKNELINICKKNDEKKVKDTVLLNFTDKALHNLNVKDIIKSIILERSIGDRWEEFIFKKLGDWDDSSTKPLKKKIDFDSREIHWNNLNDSDIEFLSTIILQFLLRKNPSPARLRRIWETTKEFFEDIKLNICDYASIQESRRKRFYWENVKVKNENKSIPDGEYQDGDVLFWASKGKVRLISYIKDLKSGKEFNLKEPTGNGNIITSVVYTDNTEFEYYQPYISIIDPTPISWQFITPAEYVPNLIDNVIKRYNESFKFVYGKLPLHIGVVIQDYKKPLYVGIKALRKIRRDVEGIERLSIEVKASKIKDILKYQKDEESLNNTHKYYSLYWGKHTKGYNFYIRPQDESNRYIANIDEIDDDKEITIIPNTFDFEFLDTNTRRNDIYYDGNNKWKRKIKLKSSRPYNLDNWEKFKKFKDLFGKQNKNGVTRSTKLQKLISVIYDNWKAIANDESKINSNVEGIKAFLASSFINILDLKKDIGLADGIKDLFDIDKSKENDKLHALLKEKMTLDNIQLFLDMFEFWHTALKEV